jgi:hypothetical protein
MAALTLRSNPSADAHRNDQIDLDTGNDLRSHSTSIELFNTSSSIEYDSTEGVERRQLFLALFAEFFFWSGRELYDSVSQWEEAKDQNSQTAFTNIFSNAGDVKTYYRRFWGLHPRHPLDLFYHCDRPTLDSVTVKNDLRRSFQRLAPNLKMTIQILELGEMNEDRHSLQVALKLRAVWKPALAEVREIRDKVRPLIICNVLIAD